MELAGLMERLQRYGDSRVSIRDAAGELLTRSYAEFRHDVERAGGFLRGLGLRQGSRAGLYADNSYEWLVLDLACIECGIFLVAFSGDTWRALGTGELFARYGLAVLFTDTTPGDADAGPVIALGDLLTQAPPRRDLAASPLAPPASDHFSLSFSSGSTGTPKGMVVSRRGAEWLIGTFQRAFGLTSGDGILIFLPLSNFQQRLLVYAALYTGAHVALTGNQWLFHDFKACAPTFFVAPPVLYKNVLKLFTLQRDGGDSLAALLGGNVRFALVGMAPIEPRVIQEFHDNGVTLLESYGLSECGTIAWNTPERCRIGTVGRPLDASEISLGEDGEILVRREAPLCLGYFGEAEDGSRIFLDDGAISTGDLGYLDDEGYLVLTGRKKNVTITASGHKYQPETIERRINLWPKVNSSVVHHSLGRQCNVAIINVEEPPGAALLAVLQNELEKLNDALPDYQKISKILVNNDAYTAENKLLTGNLKLNRHAIIARYAGEFGETADA